MNLVLILWYPMQVVVLVLYSIIEPEEYPMPVAVVITLLSKLAPTITYSFEGLIIVTDIQSVIVVRYAGGKQVLIT